jgi:predicted RNase H-like HicB family nuclease
MAESEIIFEVREDEADGGYIARTLGHSIFTEADTLEELRRNVREAADCYFDNQAAERDLVLQLKANA